jgi:membrane associated rhomboid family serine protease
MHQKIPEPYAYPVKRPIAWITWILVGTTVAVFLLQLLWLRRFGDDAIGNTLAFSPQAFAEHRYWTLITYAWVHAVAMFGDSSLFWLHIVSNMIPLVCLGPAIEDYLGHWRYLGLYVGGAIASALVWFLFNLNTYAPVIGASGAVFALIAAAGTVAPRARITVYLFFVLPIRMNLRTLAIVICAIEVIQEIPFLNFMPEVAHTAHLGGAFFGFLYVMTIRSLWRFPRVHD